jgi:hypothetical protein
MKVISKQHPKYPSKIENEHSWKHMGTLRRCGGCFGIFLQTVKKIRKENPNVSLKSCTRENVIFIEYKEQLT